MYKPTAKPRHTVEPSCSGVITIRRQRETSGAVLSGTLSLGTSPARTSDDLPEPPPS